MKPKYRICKGIEMPRNTRRVYCPIEDSNERVVSDLIPVDAITQTFPEIGVLKYGEIDWVNNFQPNEFAEYVLRSIKPEGDLFSRLTFSRVMTEKEKTVPFKTERAHIDHFWHPILKSVVFIPDKANPNVSRTKDGALLLSYNHFVREVYIPSVTEGTLRVREYFLSDTPSNIKQYPTPQPGRVSYDYLGCSGVFEECLHAKLVFPSLRTAFARYKTGEGGSSVAAALRGQVFPATSFEDWQPYVKSDEASKVDVLYLEIRDTVYPPPEPETNIR